MRLSLRIDDDVYAVASALAHSEHVSLAKAINELARRGFERPSAEQRTPKRSRNGFPVSTGKRLITAEDVSEIDAD